MTKECNSPYGYESVKGCRYMRKPHKKVYCTCTKNCARCVVANNPGLPMHPELNEEYQKQNSIKTNGDAKARGLNEVLKAREEKENGRNDSQVIVR
jgi:hypothetical protein